MSLSSLASVAFLAVLLCGAGSGLVCLFDFLRGRDQGRGALSGFPPELRWSTWAVAGLVALHGLLLALDLLGLPWSVPMVLGPLGFLALLPWVAKRAERAGPGDGDGRVRGSAPWRWGWGDGIALLAIAALVWSALSLWSTNPDFIYHWGVKGKRYALAQGIDFEYLLQPWNSLSHPDYPNLVPGLFAVTALIAGGWEERAMLLWSALFVLVAALGTRGIARELAACAFTGQAAVALVAATFALVGITHQLPGGADEILTLALLLATPALLRPTRSGEEGGDSRGAAECLLAFAAALAAGAKVEGLPLAAAMLLAYAVRQRLWWPSREGRRLRIARRLLLLGLPTLLVTAPWLYRNLSLGLFDQPNSGPVNLENLPAVAKAMGEALLHPHWHGFALAVLLLPALCFRRRFRALAAVCLVQLLVYTLAYLSARQGADFWVRSSFPRLLIHVVPTCILMGVLWLEEWFGDGGEAAPC